MTVPAGGQRLVNILTEMVRSALSWEEGHRYAPKPPVPHDGQSKSGSMSVRIQCPLQHVQHVQHGGPLLRSTTGDETDDRVHDGN